VVSRFEFFFQKNSNLENVFLLPTEHQLKSLSYARMQYIINNPCSYSAYSYCACRYCVLNRNMVVKKLDSRVLALKLISRRSHYKSIIDFESKKNIYSENSQILKF